MIVMVTEYADTRQLSSGLSSVNNLTSLVYLHLNDNQFNDLRTVNFTSLQNLSLLDMSGNRLYSPLPQVIYLTLFRKFEFL